MGVVQSNGAIANLDSDWRPHAGYGSIRFYNQFNFAYAQIYRTQPNVRTCVDFLARNIAQIGLHVFERVSDTDRKRLSDHPMAEIIRRPNPWTTKYRLIESLVGDLGIYFNAYWVKIRQGAQLNLLRVPPELVTPHGGFVPVFYEIQLPRETKKIAPDDIVHFRGYNAADPVSGLSPLETLRRILAEEHAMGEYREGFWKNAARMDGVLERPKDAPEWSDAARERFKQEWEALYSGAGGSGKTAILEEGMTYRSTSFSARDSEYVGGRKLTREECARAYHIPLPMVGILDNATFSNIKEQHKNLYQDCLGPWLEMIQEEIELQLLPDLDTTGKVYVEFNIEEKLRGSFEEQITSIQAAVGRPWMTANEARARFNLPSQEGGDELVVPLNVLMGGQASPRDSAPKGQGDGGTGFLGFARNDTGTGEYESDELDAIEADVLTKVAKAGNRELRRLRERHVEKWTEAISAYFRRQEKVIMSRVPSKSAKGIADVWGDQARWNRELKADLFKLMKATATVFGQYFANRYDAEIDPDLMDNWLYEVAKNSAEDINHATRAMVAQALLEEIPTDAVRHIFDIAATSRAHEIAVSKVTTSASFGSNEAATQGGLTSKTWVVTSSNPRDEHAAMDGETVGIGDLFSNGMRWPGDPAGGAENNANCTCELEFGRG